jgi:peroxiredoxin
MVEEGKPAPDFELTTDTGDRVRLSDLRGRPVVLYFYPKDDSLAPFDSMSASPTRRVVRR